MRYGIPLSLTLLACSGAQGGAPDASADAKYGLKSFDASVDVPTSDAPPPVDCNAGDQPSATYPAPHPAMPQVVSSGGPVIAHPRFVPIIYAGDDRAGDIASFMQAVGGSTYWTSTAAQYGVGAATAIAPIVVGDAPPQTIADSDITTWLQGELDGTHADFGDADPSSIYVIFYPEATTVQTTFGTSCLGFDGYHAQTAVGKTQVVYAVIARCNDSISLTALTSHELFEAVTDPLIYTAPAYEQLDDALYNVGFVNEIGDLCEGTGEVVPTDVGLPVQRIWSNAASMAGHTPCVPSNALFFDTVADVSESFQFGSGTARGITVPAGEARTVNLVAFSDANTQGSWTVSVVGSSATTYQQLTLTLCRKTAENGESIPLTITRPTTSTQPSTVQITSTLNSVTMTSEFYVSL